MLEMLGWVLRKERNYNSRLVGQLISGKLFWQWRKDFRERLTSSWVVSSS